MRGVTLQYQHLLLYLPCRKHPKIRSKPTDENEVSRMEIDFLHSRYFMYLDISSNFHAIHDPRCYEENH